MVEVMSNEYTPTTQEVRGVWNNTHWEYNDGGDYKAQFNRWLASYETDLRERVAQRVERRSKPKHQTHPVPYCPNCHADDVRDEVAKEIRGGSDG